MIVSCHLVTSIVSHTHWTWTIATKWIESGLTLIIGMSYCTITNKLFMHASEVPRLDWTMRSVINCLTTLNISRCATSSQMTSRKLIHTIAMQFSKPCDEEVDLDHLLQSPNRHSRFAANNCSWSYWIIIIAAAIEIQVLRDETHVFAIVNNNNNNINHSEYVIWCLVTSSFCIFDFGDDIILYE